VLLYPSGTPNPDTMYNIYLNKHIGICIESIDFSGSVAEQILELLSVPSVRTITRPSKYSRRNLPPSPPLQPCFLIPNTVLIGFCEINHPLAASPVRIDGSVSPLDRPDEANHSPWPQSGSGTLPPTPAQLRFQLPNMSHFCGSCRAPCPPLWPFSR
jgi:hypothetical protein